MKNEEFCLEHAKFKMSITFSSYMLWSAGCSSNYSHIDIEPLM